MTLPGDPNLPPGVTQRDCEPRGDDGPNDSHTCPKCGSREVSDLHAPDLWCSGCNWEWDAREPEQRCDLCGESSSDIVETIPDDGPICRTCWDKQVAASMGRKIEP